MYRRRNEGREMARKKTEKMTLPIESIVNGVNLSNSSTGVPISEVKLSRSVQKEKRWA